MDPDSHNTPISPEAQEILNLGPRAYHHEGLRRLAALLPADDEEMEAWLRSAIEEGNTGAFLMLISAASMDRRKLQARLLLLALLAQVQAFQIGWIAWHMEGEVTQELLRALEEVTVIRPEVRAMALFVATAWWQEHRKGEPVPREIIRWMDNLKKEEKKANDYTNTLLRDTDILLGRPARSRERGVTRKDLTPAQERREPPMIMALLTGPFERYIHEREANVYQGTQPLRRSVEEIGRNAPCRCGSGKKYKRCCEAADRQRLSRSSSVAGVTKEELTSESRGELTVAHFDAMNPGDMLTLNPAQVPKDLQKRYVVGLLVLKAYEKAIAAFRVFGVPEHLKSVWSHMFKYVVDSWRPEIARQLMEILPDAEEQFGEKTHAGIRVLLVGDDPAQALAEIESSAEALLASGDLYELQQMVGTLLQSPYRGLGILIARGLLPIAEEELVPELFEEILNARAKLNLPLEDEFSPWMDERALREAARHETAEMQAMRDAFQAKQEVIRAAQEKIAQLERDKLLSERKERREAAEFKARAITDEEQERECAHKAEKGTLIALLKEANQQKLEMRRELEKKTLAEKQSAAEPSENSRGGEDEEYQVEGNQPVRLLRFPKDFAETLAAFPRHVGRATMSRLGQLAAGEPSGFDKIKQLKAYPEVLRARLADKHRLLFCLEPGHIRVVDLIRRADLDRRIERLKSAGLPAVV